MWTGWKILLLLVAGLGDRVRGGFPVERPKALKYLSMASVGLIMGLLVTSSIKLILASGLLVLLGSWRTDNGWRGGYVQGQGLWWKPLRWGALWGTPFVLLGYWEPLFFLMPFCGALGAFLAIHIAVKLPPIGIFDLKHGWPWSELIEMPIIGLIVIILLEIIHGF